MRKHQQPAFWALFILSAILSGFLIVRQTSLPYPQAVSFTPFMSGHQRGKTAHYAVLGLTDVQMANKALIAQQFKDYPAMIDVLRCESGFKQQDDDGNVLTSSTADYGIAQINLKTWGAKAKELGLDIFNSTQDNLKMARYILDNAGIKSWVCYNKVR